MSAGKEEWHEIEFLVTGSKCEDGRYEVKLTATCDHFEDAAGFKLFVEDIIDSVSKAMQRDLPASDVTLEKHNIAAGGVH